MDAGYAMFAMGNHAQFTKVLAEALFHPAMSGGQGTGRGAPRRGSATLRSE